MIREMKFDDENQNEDEDKTNEEMISNRFIIEYKMK